MQGCFCSHLKRLYLLFVILHLADVILDGIKSMLEEILLLFDCLYFVSVVEESVELGMLVVLLNGTWLVFAIYGGKR